MKCHRVDILTILAHVNILQPKDIYVEVHDQGHFILPNLYHGTFGNSAEKKPFRISLACDLVGVHLGYRWKAELIRAP